MQKVWGSLGPLDFERTTTGVLRCFTSVRVAAGGLRSFGLLRFSRKERRKVWALSLRGFVVSAAVLGSCSSWELLLTGGSRPYADLHPAVSEARKALATREGALGTLSAASDKARTVVRARFQSLSAAYDILQRHQEEKPEIGRSSLSRAKRIAWEEQMLSPVEDVPGLDDFYGSFSRALQK